MLHQELGEWKAALDQYDYSSSLGGEDDDVVMHDAEREEVLGELFPTFSTENPLEAEEREAEEENMMRDDGDGDDEENSSDA